MIKRTAAALALILTVACASTPLSSSSNESSGGAATVTSSIKNAPDYISLSAPNQIRTYDFGNSMGVRGLHIRGTMTNAGFKPAGDIQGNGKFCAEGKDWLGLRDLTIHTASSGATPTAPYVLGCATGTAFQPSSRTVVMQ